MRLGALRADAKLMDALPALRVISTSASGTKHRRRAAKQRGIAVANTPTY